MINIEIEAAVNKETIKAMLEYLYIDAEPDSKAWAILFDFNRLMERCRFSKKELRTIDLLRKGYTETKIAKVENISRQGINKRIDLIADKIVKEYALSEKMAEKSC